jgi:hypothetical protein
MENSNILARNPESVIPGHCTLQATFGRPLLGADQRAGLFSRQTGEIWRRVPRPVDNPLAPVPTA